MPQIDVEGLVDHELIARAEAKANGAFEYDKASEATLQAAVAARKDAEFCSRNSPSLENEERLDRLTKEERVAEKTRKNAADYHRRMQAWLPLARGAAAAGLYQAGVRARIAAARKVDEARALLIEARTEFRAAVDICQQAAVYGHQHFPAHQHQMLLPGEAPLELWLSEGKTTSVEQLERNRWAQHQISPDSNTNSWAEHVLKQEP